MHVSEVKYLWYMYIYKIILIGNPEYWLNNICEWNILAWMQVSIFWPLMGQAQIQTREYKLVFFSDLIYLLCTSLTQFLRGEYYGLRFWYWEAVNYQGSQLWLV